jgi:F-type H+-transporting ATPase subunit b
MKIDFWGLGLQAVNVLILVWLLSRVFWRPVAKAIATRRDTAHAMLASAKDTQSRADAALAEVTKLRAGIAAEREAVLTAATASAEMAKKATLKAAHDEAEELIAAARRDVDRNTETARKENAVKTSELAVNIAAKLLVQLNTPAVQEGFLTQLVKAIARMSPADKAALSEAKAAIELVSATELDEASKAKTKRAVMEALGGSPELSFVVDPELIAGLEIRTAHFVLHNSWKSDLARILKDLKNAA